MHRCAPTNTTRPPPEELGSKRPYRFDLSTLGKKLIHAQPRKSVPEVFSVTPSQRVVCVCARFASCGAKPNFDSPKQTRTVLARRTAQPHRAPAPRRRVVTSECTGVVWVAVRVVCVRCPAPCCGHPQIGVARPKSPRLPSVPTRPIPHPPHPTSPVARPARVAYFFDSEVGNAHYGQGHPMKVRAARASVPFQSPFSSPSSPHPISPS